MARPSKPTSVLRMEGRSHRTKAELEQREKAEQATLTGVKMREAEDVKADPVAHAVWKRTKKLLSAIGKDDALYEQVMNRYCRLSSELEGVMKTAARLDRMAGELDAAKDAGEIEGKDYAEQMRWILEQKSLTETLVMRKRKFMTDIEKENVMTIASALRSIPKNVDADEADDPMSRMLAERMAARREG